MIAIIDYGMGNLRSVQKAFEKVGADAVVTDSPEDVAKAGKAVLPGVGAIKPAMDRLNEMNMTEAVLDFVKSGRPFLGICLGYQLLFEASDEGGDVPALGILKGRVKRFTQGKVPHMGWNQLAFRQADCPLLKNIPEGTNTYFCHSYYVAPDDRDCVLTETGYGITFASSVAKDNIFGTQFHPEKSQTAGLALLKNFNEV